jgi:hypothetical protein
MNNRRIRPPNQYGVFAFMMMLFLSSCLSNKAPELLTDAQCEPPCWFDIVPGSTTVAEALELLQSLPIPGEIKTAEPLYSPSSPRYSIWWNPEGRNSIYNVLLLFLDEKVLAIRIGINPRQLPLENAIEIYGDPEHYKAIDTQTGYNNLRVNLYFPSKGIWMELYPYHLDKGEPAYIRPKNTVWNLYYYDPREAEAFFSAWFMGSDIVQIQKEWVPWTGFGEIIYEIGQRVE